MTDVKIFISYKDRHKILKSDILTPIQTGRAISDEIFEDMIGDDTGDNISAENDIYAELTAQYWVWKNYDKIGNPDYVGFMHYRRHFIFNEKYVNKKQDKQFRYGYSAYTFNNLDERYLSDIHLQDNYINNTVKDNDIIFVKKANTRYLGCKNGLEDFLKNCYGSHKEDYDRCMQIVKNLYPEYSNEIEQLQKGPYRYYYNMFVMKKEFFFKYSEFLFSALAELKKEIHTEFYSEKAKRVLGYMGEFLLSLFAFKISKNKNLKIKELYSTFIKNTEDLPQLNLAFVDKNPICIAMSSSGEYTPYLSVCLQSLIENINTENYYDIIVFERNILPKNKELLKKQVEQKNISLRFVNPVSLLTQYDLKYSGNYNLECFFRLTAPLILKNYSKVIFTDIDLIFNRDIKDLYETNIENLPLAACKDLMWGAFLNNSHDDWNKYAEKILKLPNKYNYFNTGVMLLNIDEFNKNNYSQKLLELVSKNSYRILEQDGLNVFFKDNIKYIDTAWNYAVENSCYTEIIKYMPEIFYNQYLQDKLNPYIIHWAGVNKPWFSTDEEFVDIWWNYARKTPFYEEILRRMCSYSSVPIEIFKDVLQYKKNLIGYWKYKLLRNFTFGKQRQRYINKKHLLKHKISVAKNVMR